MAEFDQQGAERANPALEGGVGGFEFCVAGVFVGELLLQGLNVGWCRAAGCRSLELSDEFGVVFVESLTGQAGFGRKTRDGERAVAALRGAVEQSLCRVADLSLLAFDAGLLLAGGHCVFSGWSARFVDGGFVLWRAGRWRQVRCHGSLLAAGKSSACWCRCAILRPWVGTVMRISSSFRMLWE